MRRVGQWVADCADIAFNFIAPLEFRSRNYLMALNGDDLAQAEADIEVWEPNPADDDELLADWERELRDAFLHTPEQPAGPGHPHQPAQAGAGGSPTDDVATIVAVILRGQGIHSAPIFADLIATELHHHFDFYRK